MPFFAYQSKRSVSKSLPIGSDAKQGKMMSLVGRLLRCLSAFYIVPITHKTSNFIILKM